MRKFVKTALALVACLAVGTAAFAGPTTTVKTAQSVEVNATLEGGDFQIDGTATWNFDWSGVPPTDADFFTYFTYTTSFTGTSQAKTSLINTAKHEAFKKNKCNFWFGTPLIETSKTTGTGTVTCTPISLTGPTPHTGWTLGAVTFDGLPTVTVGVSDLYVASESVLVKSGVPKYSFTMTQNGVSRLTALSYELVKLGATELDPDVTVVSGDIVGVDPITLAAFDNTTIFAAQDPTGVLGLQYTANGGYFGDGSTTDPLSGAAAYLRDGSVFDTLNGLNGSADVFKGNNGIGEDQAVANEGELDPLTRKFGVADAGTYLLVFTGRVKGNDFSAVAVDFTIVVNFVTVNACEP